MGMLTKKQLTGIYCHMAAKRRENEALDAAAPLVVAVKVNYNTPQSDGIYEILFMRDTEAKNFQAAFGKSETIPFAEGVTLAGQPDCCGGFHALKDARRFQGVNPYVQGLKLSPI